TTLWKFILTQSETMRNPRIDNKVTKIDKNGASDKVNDLLLKIFNSQYKLNLSEKEIIIKGVEKLGPEKITELIQLGIDIDPNLIEGIINNSTDIISDIFKLMEGYIHADGTLDPSIDPSILDEIVRKFLYVSPSERSEAMDVFLPLI